MNILLLGGSKSGKSGLAQRLCVRLAAGAPMIYWATMEPVDGEDRARIARHLDERAGWGFSTVECGRALERAALPERACVLFDSVTALLANELLALARSCRHLVCVCDDIFRDGAAYDEWTERYRSGLARVCRTLAAEFDTVCEVVAGLPHLWKGELP